MFKEHPGVRRRPGAVPTHPIMSGPTASASAVAVAANPGFRSAPAAPAPVRPISPAATAEKNEWESDRASGLRKLAFVFALAILFLRYSQLHEIFTYTTGANSYILYLLMPPALLAIFMFGGLRRVFSKGIFETRLAYYWMAFVLFMGLAVIMSSWRGGSLLVFITYAKTEITMLFIVGAIAMGWKECRTMMLVCALGGATVLFASRALVTTVGERVGLAPITIGNPNDYAAHLILVSAFLLYVVLTPTVNLVFRAAALACLAYSLYSILSTASRGAFLAILVLTLFVLIRASARTRLSLMIIVPLICGVAFALQPADVRTRILTLTGSGGSLEAIESSEARMYELQNSISQTVKHPLLGVGPGQFSTIEGTESRQAGQRGAWRETHNAYTQISAECGIPALLCFVGALLSTYLLLNRVYKHAKSRPGGEEIARAAFCLMLALIGIGFSVFFLSQGYRFYYPTLGGLALALASAAEHQLGQPAPRVNAPALPTPRYGAY